MKTGILKHIHNIKPDILRYVEENTVFRLQLMAENNVQQNEHTLHKSRDK